MSGAASDVRRGARPYDLADAAYDQPDYEGPPRCSLVVCTHPRSGSTLLGEALAFAGGLGLPLEYFHRGFRPAFERRWETHGLAALTRASHRRRTDPSGVFAAKLFWVDVLDIALEAGGEDFRRLWTAAPGALSDADYRAAWALAAPLFPHPTFIHLTRRDRVRQAVSQHVAQRTGLWRAIPQLGTEVAEQAPQYDRDRIAYLVGLAEQVDAHWTRLFAALRQVPIVVTYEDLERDYGATVTALLRRLGSTAPALAPRLRRQSDAATEAFVIRYLREAAQRVR